MVDQEIIDLPNDDALPDDTGLFVPLQKTIADSRRRSLGNLREFMQTPWQQQINANTQNIISLGLLNTHTIPSGTDTFAMLALAQVLTNKTLTLPFIASFLNATHNHQNAAGGNPLVATTALTATGTKDNTTFLRGDDTWDIPPGADTPFTWAATDEDSPLPPDNTILYITEPADKTRTATEVIAGLKNTSTGANIFIEIEKETAVNSNAFSAFAELRIDINDFTSQTSLFTPVIFVPGIWESGSPPCG